MTGPGPNIERSQRQGLNAVSHLLELVLQFGAPRAPPLVKRWEDKSVLVGGGLADILQFQALGVRSHSLADAK